MTSRKHTGLKRTQHWLRTLQSAFEICIKTTALPLLAFNLQCMCMRYSTKGTHRKQWVYLTSKFNDVHEKKRRHYAFRYIFWKAHNSQRDLSRCEQPCRWRVCIFCVAQFTGLNESWKHSMTVRHPWRTSLL